MQSRDACDCAAGVSGKMTNGAADIQCFVKVVTSRESREHTTPIFFLFFSFPPPADVFGMRVILRM